MPGIVERVDRERLRKEGDKLFEYIELGSERMQQEEVGARPSLDLADSVASDYGLMDLDPWIPVQRRGRVRPSPQRLHSKRDEDEQEQGTDDNEQQVHVVFPDK